MSPKSKFLDDNYFDENPELRERARQLSNRWEDVLEDFLIPCPMCRGEMKMQGVSPTRLYEFAEGEPGTVNPMDLLPIAFICTRCGYTAEFDSQLFNPAYLARLEGAPANQIDRLSLRDYHILVPLRGNEHNETLLDLASAIAKSRNGDVTVLDASNSESMSDRLADKVQNYHPLVGGPAPVTFIHRTPDSLKTNLAQAITHNHSRLLLIEDRGWGNSGQAEVSPLIEEIMRDDLCEVAIVNDRGLQQVNRVLLATSGGPNAKAAAPLVLDIVRGYDAELHLLYIASPGEPDRQAIGQARIAETLEGLNTEGIKLQKRIIADSDPVQALISESGNYDLLVIGGSPRNWRSKMMFNSHSGKVARNSDTTTIIVITPGDQPLPFFNRLFKL